MSGNEKLERELESFLAEENSRVAALYRKLPRHEPDAALDASVLAMARRAVAPRQTRHRWLPALSAAAAVLVVAGVAYRAGPQVWNDHGTQSAAPVTRTVDETKPTTVSPASPPVAAAPPAQEPSSAVTANLGVHTAKSVSTPAPSARADALARQKTAEAPRLQSTAPAPQAFPQPETAAVEIQEKRLDKSTATAPPPPARDAPLQSLDAAVFPPNESQKAESASASELEQKDGTPSRAESMTGALKGGAAQPSAPAPASAEFAPAPAAAAMKPAPDHRLYPEHWISNIEKMLRENRRAEAIRSLEQFRRQYPDYRLPDDLQDLK